MGKRCCGVRQQGGLYLEVPPSPYGKPWWEFVIDPPIPVGGLPYPSRGMVLFPDPHREGVWHLLDRVGRQYYPHVADFVEEFSHMGLSRRIPTNLDLGKLTAESLLFVAHDDAYLGNWQELRAVGVDQEDHLPWLCPTCQSDHAPWEVRLSASEWAFDPLCSVCCSGTWWQVGERPKGKDDKPDLDRQMRREIPCCTYGMRMRPYGFYPEFVPALFMRFKASRFVVITANRPEKEEKAWSAAEKLGGFAYVGRASE